MHKMLHDIQKSDLFTGNPVIFRHSLTQGAEIHKIKVTDSLTKKYQHVRKELNDLMGGKVLEFRGEREFNEGKKQGEINGLIGLVYDGLLSEDIAVKRAKEKYNISPTEFQKMLDSYDPDEELMQG